MTWAAHALGRPAHREDERAYAATQQLADALKHRGLDGILYASALGPGYNLALFSASFVRVNVTELFRVTASDYRWEAIPSIPRPDFDAPEFAFLKDEFSEPAP
jgi:hypothetical protein